MGVSEQPHIIWLVRAGKLCLGPFAAGDGESFLKALTFCSGEKANQGS